MQVKKNDLTGFQTGHFFLEPHRQLCRNKLDKVTKKMSLSLILGAKSVQKCFFASVRCACLYLNFPDKATWHFLGNVRKITNAVSFELNYTLPLAN